MAIINIIVNIVLLACIFINIFSARKYRKKLRALNDDFELLRDFERQLIEDAREVIKAQEAYLKRKEANSTIDAIMHIAEENERGANHLKNLIWDAFDFKSAIRFQNGESIYIHNGRSNEEEN